MEVTPGNGEALGAHRDGSGTMFTVESRIAEAVELSVFGQSGEERIELPRLGSGSVFSGRVEGVGVGTEYGFRVHGPWDPSNGLRCNPHKLLLDPYARRIDGMVKSSPALTGHIPSDLGTRSRRDSAPFTMRSVVTGGGFDWGDDRHPRTPRADTVIYETHVKGLTRLHPDLSPELRGTYAGLANEATIGHLTSLGITAIELLPVHQFVQDPHLTDIGLRNYWGYNSIGFFAPHNEYAATDDVVAEFKGMVKALHAAGIEVILDVVYNHTAEGDRLGPTLCFRGLDNPTYYRLDADDRSRYLNWTGTGNTLNVGDPVTLRLVMDSLRYWVRDMHVDGFRFDLASVMGRTADAFDPLGGFFGAVAQDPVLRGVKMIAEPWDLGPGGYQVGGFPRGWSEWNDQYRDTVRDMWRGAGGVLGEFATRITGSSDVYEHSGRRPTASINFVASHDGFTLTDLVSYDHRHNDANAEEGLDGHADNRSWNGGVEGSTDDPEIQELRARRRRSLLATLLLSQGVPMILGGDEIGRTQGGNNNAYNQDNEISWFDWEGADWDLCDFTRRLVALRAAHPTFRRVAWLHEHVRPARDHVGWFTPGGEEMSVEDWRAPAVRSVALFLEGGMVHSADGPVSDADFILMFNANAEPIEFVIPVENGSDLTWELVLDTAEPKADAAPVGESVDVGSYGLVVLRRR